MVYPGLMFLQCRMRGVESQAMLLACTDPSDPNKLELVQPPPDSKPGDKASWEHYPGNHGSSASL